MKKELLLASALLTVISAFPQNKNATQQTVTKDNSAAEYEARFNLMYNPIEKNLDPSKISQPTGPVQPLQRSGAVSSWTPISGSMNIYGMLVSNSKPLQYHQALNAVSFIHRKSLSYVPLPAPSQSNAATGVIVAQIASNIDALSWDSTCIWNNNTNWARYPQGAIYNPPGNTSLSNAYVVASGPITQANNTLGWVGSYLTSKKLNVFDNVASTVPNAQQFIPNATSVGKIYSSFIFVVM